MSFQTLDNNKIDIAQIRLTSKRERKKGIFNIRNDKDTLQILQISKDNKQNMRTNLCQ